MNPEDVAVLNTENRRAEWIQGFERKGRRQREIRERRGIPDAAGQLQLPFTAEELLSTSWSMRFPDTSQSTDNVWKNDQSQCSSR